MYLYLHNILKLIDKHKNPNFFEVIMWINPYPYSSSSNCYHTREPNPR